ncbi:hypothetical protein [Pseudomonas sp. GM60]|uniref:hypothetical protein n=1 Tax=Pseudomonas sp. GM60 TaxID=1144334 RepID=UPI00027065A5|nr:hypothetical protein [Pseudomonas sp. GM60]EJM86603.1 hypothetical protein PMI32_00599 [Pseudomonas sp. GM60]
MPEVIEGRWSFNDLKRWTCGETDAALFDDDYAEDPDAVDMNILGECGDAGILELISNPSCRARSYFADLLALSLCNVFRSDRDLPFHFSRFLGIKSLEDYMSEVEEVTVRVYEACLVIDSMKSITDPAIQSLYKQIMDFRHAKTSSVLEFYWDCRRKTDFSLFETDADS